MNMYWHLFNNVNDIGVYTAALIGPSEFSADTPAVNGVPPKHVTFPDAMSQSDEKLTWAATFDHEPTELEKDYFAPDGYKSTDEEVMHEETSDHDIMDGTWESP